MQEQTKTPPDRPLRVLQISDTHPCADPADHLLGLNTQRCFEGTLDLLQANHWPADLLLVTGDLVHGGSSAGYNRLHEGLAALEIPVYCLPGNHDEPDLLRRSLNGNRVRTVPAARHGAWAFVFIDSTRPGSPSGHLSAGELERLEQSLALHAAHHCLVCLHHQPVPIGSAWLDSVAVANPAALFAVLERWPQVRGVLWGHVHQSFDAIRNGIRLLACPSTCAQFRPGTEQYTPDALTPGYRWLKLHPDGRIDTGVERMARYPDGPESAASGYW
jgi:Icc protein